MKSNHLAAGIHLKMIARIQTHPIQRMVKSDKPQDYASPLALFLGRVGQKDDKRIHGRRSGGKNQHSEIV